jgi:arylsulfatase A-like enzyme/Tfp pilus assembly protein PilF
MISLKNGAQGPAVRGSGLAGPPSVTRRGAQGLPYLVAAIVGVLACCGSSEKEAPALAKLRPVNVLLVTIDTLRADRLGCYGYQDAATPVLDGLAASGALFENAVAPTPLTPPSHASMFTGQYPHVHGVRNTGGFVLQSSSVTLAEILQQQGWDTAAFVGASVLKKIVGLDQGFTTYDDQMPKPDASRQMREDPERSAAAVVDRAITWLDGQSGGPFFLWVHVFDPHIPYEPPAPFDQQYRARPYDGEVAYTDRELGRLFEAVGKKAPPQETLTVVMADHGESLSEHGEFTHGIFLYESTLHIPFLLSGPGVPAGLRVKQQARTIDLLPTLLDLLGGSAPPESQGVSLVPAFQGEEVATEPSYHESLFPKMNMGWAELRAMRTNRWKYIHAPRRELYDLAADPGETTNVLDRFPQEAAHLEEQLKETARSSEKVQARMVDGKTMQQLKSLGYLSDGFSPPEYELTGKGIDPKDRVGILELIQVAVPLSSGLSPARRIELLRKGVEQDPANPSLYYHLGAEYEKAGRHRQALELYQAALGQGIRSGRLHSRIGDLYLREGKKAEAIAAYEDAGRINPYEVESQNNLATAYLEAGRVADATRVFDFILSVEEYAPAHNGLGLIAIQRQDMGSAQRHFERAVKLDPDLVESQLNLGLIYKMQGDRDRARACFEAFVARAPRNQYGPLIPKVEAEIAMLQQAPAAPAGKP